MALLGFCLGGPNPAPEAAVPESTSAPGRIEGVVTFKNGGAVEDAVIYLVPENGADARSASAPVAGSYRIDQRGLRFEPHVLVVPVGATVDFTNSDAVLHNIFVPRFGGGGFDLGTWPRGQTRRHTFDEPGVSVLLCNVHPDMEAFIVVVPTPHYVITDEDGSFAIDDVPPGPYRLVAWHERCDPYEARIDVAEGTRQIGITLSIVASG